MPKVHAHLPDALQNPDLRRACRDAEAIFRAGNILDELPPACLEEVRDYCSTWNDGRKGSFSEFRHAWIDMVAERLNDQRLRENRLYHRQRHAGAIDVVSLVKEYDPKAGVSQPDISRILRGSVKGHSESRLMIILAALGNNVSIVVQPSKGHGQISGREQAA
jgi:hypothetical protein